MQRTVVIIMSREAIFSQLRRVTQALPQHAAYPHYETSQLVSHPKLLAGDDHADFCRNFTAVNGKVMHALDELATFLQQHHFMHGYCDPRLMSLLGEPLRQRGFTVETELVRERYDDYHFGITMATAAIAETGSLILDDHHTSDRLAALAPWVHVAVLQQSTIIHTVSEAIANLGSSSNVIWATGPSKTADVEGILIEGVHGPGEQIAFVTSEPLPLVSNPTPPASAHEG